MTNDKTLKALFAILIAIILLALSAGCFLAIQSIGRIKEVEQASEDLDARNLRFTPRLRAQIYRVQAVSLRARMTGDDAYSKQFEILKNDLQIFVNSRAEIFNQQEEQKLYESLHSKLSLYLSELTPEDHESNPESDTDQLSEAQERLADMSESLQRLGDGLTSMELRWQLQRCHVRLLMAKVKGTQKQVDLFKEIVADLKETVLDAETELAGEERKTKALQVFSAKLERFESNAETMTTRWIKQGSAEKQFQGLEKLQEMRDEVIEIAQSLGDSRREVFQSSLKDYRSLAKSMQYSIFIALGMLFVSLFTMGWLARKAFLAPIKSSLADAEKIATSREDLANIGTLAAGVAHEIRNPITAIKARLFALEELARSDNSMSRQIEAIQGETNRMEGIVQDFLSFARPSNTNLERTDIAEFLDDIHTLSQPDVTSRGASLIVGRTAEGRTLIDPEQLKQVFINLIRNATDACPPDGGEVCLSSSRKGNQISFSVSDNGSGISEEHQSQIFEPFFSKKKGGTGLGLPICRNIVEAHHGTLTYESSDQGTTFTISLQAI